MKYIYVLRKVDQNYVAFVPDLPGCVASGKTASEARAAMKTTVDMHLKGLAADGLSIPQPVVKKDYPDPIQPLTQPKPSKKKPSKLQKLLKKVHR
jgi:predicted RNase H-like HicB family nuclease